MIMKEHLSTKATMRLLNLHVANTPEYKYYTTLTSNGEFYAVMMDEFVRHNIKFTDREDFKKQIFTVFFGRNDAIN
jgi:hypothetical protein